MATATLNECVVHYRNGHTQLVVRAHGRHVNIWKRLGRRQDLRFVTPKTLYYYARNHMSIADPGLVRLAQDIAGNLAPVDTKPANTTTANYRLWPYLIDGTWNYFDGVGEINMAMDSGFDVVEVARVDTSNNMMVTSLKMVLDDIATNLAARWANYTAVHCCFCRAGYMWTSKLGGAIDPQSPAMPFRYA